MTHKKFEQRNQDALHGVTLKTIVTELEAYYGWDVLAEQVKLNCFKIDPSIKSSLNFLRKTPWARTRVENLYVKMRWLADNNLTQPSSE